MSEKNIKESVPDWRPIVKELAKETHTLLCIVSSLVEGVIMSPERRAVLRTSIDGVYNRLVDYNRIIDESMAGVNNE